MAASASRTASGDAPMLRAAAAASGGQRDIAQVRPSQQPQLQGDTHGRKRLRVYPRDRSANVQGERCPVRMHTFRFDPHRCRPRGTTPHPLHRVVGHHTPRRAVVRIEDQRSAVAQVFEEQTFGAEIFAKRPVIVLVLERDEVRQDPEVEADARQAILHEGVGCRLHGDEGAASPMRQRALKHRGIGSGEPGLLERLPIYAYAERTKRAHAPAGPREYRFEHRKRGGFAHRAGDADHIERTSRVPVPRGGKLRQRPFGTFTIGTPGGDAGSSSTTTALAPRSMACGTKSWPSTVSPRIATNIHPRSTSPESAVMPATSCSDRGPVTVAPVRLRRSAASG